MGRDGSTVGARLRLDRRCTPPSGHEDIIVGPGIPVDEWDYRKHMLLPDHCRVQELIGRHDGGILLPEHLRKHAARLKQQFSALVPQRHWLKGQPDGSEPDIDACVRLYTDHLAATPERRRRARHEAGRLPRPAAPRARSVLPGAGRPLALHRCLGLAQPARHRCDPRQPDAVLGSA